MLATSADLPIDGRAAITIRLPGWKPPVFSSRSLNPDGVPVSARLGDRQPVQLVGLLVRGCRAIERIFFWRSSCATSSTDALGALHQVARRRLTREHAGLDLVGRGQQRPQLGVVVDDPAVLAGVPGGRHPAGELVDRLRPADLVELAVLAQRLGDRQVVDLAVAVVELEHRREHRAVLLAVEVLGPQLLLDQQRVQMALVEQHRAEHRLLGLEVVRRDGDVLDGAHARSESRFGAGGTAQGVPATSEEF